MEWDTAASSPNYLMRWVYKNSFNFKRLCLMHFGMLIAVREYRMKDFGKIPMLKHMKKLVLIFIATPLSFLGCGNDGTNTLPPGFFQGVGGFRVVAHNPEFGAAFVDITQDIRVRFSEPLNPASVTPGNFKVIETIGTNVNDRTSQASIGFASGNTELIISLPQLVLNADYKVTFFNGITSASGNSLAFVTDLIFSTGPGQGFGFGTNVKADAPFVQSIELLRESYGCLSFMVTFSEDLAQAPIVRVKLQQFVGVYVDLLNTLAPVAPAITNRHDRYVVLLPNDGCGPDFVGIDRKLVVTVEDAFDLSGQQLEKPKSKEFTSLF